MIASRKALIVVAAFVLMAVGLPWGGSVPSAFAQISVTAADPPTGEQGALNLNVIIKGKGFKNGAKAKWFKTGTTDPAGVNVKSTQFVSSTQLIATIDIADWATLSLFDIQVANTDGRTGKGTELFSVLEKAPTSCTLPDPVPSPSSFISYSPGLPGYLDGNFGDGAGRVIGPRHMVVGYFYGQPVAIQNIDGQAKVVAVGYISDTCANSGGSYIWAVARHLPDGSLDSAFGSGGVVTMSLGSGSQSPRSVVVQPDNKIVVVGSSTSKGASLPTVVRLNANGGLDTTFGSSGVVVLTPAGKSPSGLLTGVAIQSDGKIVAAGTASGMPLYMVRLNPSGSVDANFRLSYSGPSGQVHALRLQKLGTEERIVLAGGSSTPIGYRAAVWRFTSSGGPDTTFGGTGMVVTLFQGDSCPYQCEEMFNDVAIDGSNRITAMGYARRQIEPAPSVRHIAQIALARYDTTGGPDPTFGIGGSGYVLAPTSQPDTIVTAGALQVDGRIVVAGKSNWDTAAGAETDRTVGVWRFDADGMPDYEFGAGGGLSDPVAGSADLVYFTGMAVQPDGQIVCGGYIIMSGDPRIRYAVLARFWQ